MARPADTRGLAEAHAGNEGNKARAAIVAGIKAHASIAAGPTNAPRRSQILEGESNVRFIQFPSSGFCGFHPHVHSSVIGELAISFEAFFLLTVFVFF